MPGQTFEIGKEKLLGEMYVRDLLQKILNYSSCDQTEVIFANKNRCLTRYANNAITQNISEKETAVRVRVISDGRIGLSACNDLREASLRRTVDSAIRNARLLGADNSSLSLPLPSAYGKVCSYFANTAEYSAASRAKQVQIICREAAGGGYKAGGFFSTECLETAVANTHGLFAYYPQTVAEMNVFFTSRNGAGFASACSADVSTIYGEALAKKAAGRMARSELRTIDPGEYPVVLEPDAVSEMLSFLAAYGFSAAAVQMNQDSTGLGSKCLSEKISIWDDGLSPEGLPVPFDCEGVPKQSLPLVEKGVFKNVVYDNSAARQFGKKSTGHNLPVMSSIWPLPPHISARCQPTNLFVGPGENSRQDLIGKISKGIVITRFHYNRLVHPLGTVVTGTTRGGTFLIENGEITKPIYNLRYTQSFWDALKQVEAVGSEPVLHRSSFGAHFVPALCLSAFRFVANAADG